jgi:DUF4097 and DUF4098 domain-containing protein YvlB
MYVMHHWTTSALVALVLVGVPAAAQESVTWRWNGTLSEGRTLFVHNVNGDVRVEVGAGNRVEVEAEKRWRRGNPADVAIEARQLSNGNVVICALWRRGATCNEDGIQGGERRTNRNNDVSVRFVIRVPAYAQVNANSVNGNVEVAELGGRVDARTVNGSVRASSSAGPVSARTVNGSIHAKGLAGREPMEYETVNGNIEIELPAATNVNLSLRTTNGRITSDFPITVTGEINPRRIDATVGEGGAELRGRTVNGSIRVRRY